MLYLHRDHLRCLNMSSAPKPQGLSTAKVADVIAAFAPTRKFDPPPGSKPYAVTSIDFDDTGELALVAQDDGILQIYNCKEGKEAKELRSQKYGVDLARFGHHSQSVFFASTMGNGKWRVACAAHGVDRLTKTCRRSYPIPQCA